MGGPGATGDSGASSLIIDDISEAISLLKIIVELIWNHRRDNKMNRHHGITPTNSLNSCTTLSCLINRLRVRFKELTLATLMKLKYILSKSIDFYILNNNNEKTGGRAYYLSISQGI